MRSWRRLFCLLLVVWAAPANASFHLMQIEQVIGGVNGDVTAQAIQLRMRAAGENFIAGAQLVVVDAAGQNPISLITFPSDVGSGAGRRILITTPNFSTYQATPIASDFTTNVRIPASYLAAGRLLYQLNGPPVWSLSWGGSNYTGPNTGTMDNDANGNFGPPFAGVLPSTSTVALRFNGTASAPSTNNAADYSLTSGSATFTNNAGVSTTLIAPTPTPTPTPTPNPGATPATLGNISTRLQVGTAENVLIAGVIIDGSVPKRVFIRGRGPSLSGFGILNPMANPHLELHDSASMIAMNHDWPTTEIGGIITANQATEIQNNGLRPDNAAEPAMIVSLTPGSYTAILQGENAGTGIATVEVYDLSPNEDARLVNISTRGLVQTGDNVMIGGFIILSQPTRLFIRATGPTLASFGLANALSDPQLQLHDASDTIATNDDWQTTQVGGVITSNQAAEIQANALKPAQAAEPAMIVTLQPGSYTVIVSGANNAVGVATVEIYAIQ